MFDFVDWRGNKINDGDTVVYTVRTGSLMYMIEGKVIERTYGNTDWRGIPIPMLKVRPNPELCQWTDPNRIRTVSLAYVTKV